MSHRNHKCKNFRPLGGCPFSGLLELDDDNDRERDEPDDENPRRDFVGFPSRRSKPSSGLDTFDVQRAADMVALEALVNRGQVGVPSLANGGVLSLFSMLAKFALNPFLNGPQAVMFGSPLQGRGAHLNPANFDESFVEESLKASQRFTPADMLAGSFLDGQIGALIKAVAFAGAITAGAGLTLSAARRPGTGRTTPQGGGTGRGAGGFTFRAPTFRPGLVNRRQLDFSSINPAVSGAEIGPGV